MSVRRLAAGSAALYGAEGLARGAALVLTIFLARTLGVAGLGEYGFGISLTAALSTLTDCGISMYFLRRASQGSDRETTAAFYGVLLARFGLSLLPLCALLVYAATSLPTSLGLLVAWVTMAQVPSVLLSVSSVVLQARHSVVQSAGLRALNGLLTLGLAIPLTHRHGLAGVGMAIWISAWVAALLALVAALRGRAVASAAGWAEVRAELALMRREVRPFVATVVFSSFFQRADSLILFYLAGATALGAYTAAYRLYEVLYFLQPVLSTVLFPVLARAHLDPPGRVLQLGSLALRYSALAGWVAATLSFQFNPLFFDLLFREAPEAAVEAYRVLAWALVPAMMSGIYHTILSSGSTPHRTAQIVGGMLALSVALNLLLIPHLGPVGSAVAQLVCESAGILLSHRMVRHEYGALPTAGALARPALVFGPALLLGMPFPLPWNGVVTALSLLVLFPLLHGFDQVDRNVLRSLRGGSGPSPSGEEPGG